MRNNWLFQGIVSNWISSALVLLGAALLTALSHFQSQWLYPVLYGLMGMVGSLACVLMIRALYGVRPSAIEPRIRLWLDGVGASTKTVALAGSLFCYEVTFNNKLILVAQSATEPRYVDIHVNLDFTDEDNQRLQNVPGGLDGVIRGMRQFLALTKIGHNAIVAPLKRISLNKRVLITAGFDEEKFMEAFSLLRLD